MREKMDAKKLFTHVVIPAAVVVGAVAVGAYVLHNRADEPDVDELPDVEDLNDDLDDTEIDIE